VNDKTVELATNRGITEQEFDEALLQFVFHLESCDEAVQVFEGMSVCPVCGAVESKGLMVHRDFKEMVQ
jgi:hypothetical protein